MVGEDFAALLAAAQCGSEQAFSVLWRDVNPALLRYLRVVAAEYAEDVAAETWVQVVRGAVDVNGKAASAGDGVAIEGERKLTITSHADNSEILVFDLP